jgi:hypothetical protein
VPTLRRKPVDLTAWHLIDLTQMAAAFTALTTEGWRGGISADSTGALRLELNRDNPARQVIAAIGDWLVLDMGLRLISATECSDNYDEAGGS